MQPPAANESRSHRSHPLRAYSPLIVNVALTGGVLARDRAPHLPLTAEEIIADAERCWNAGATIVHVHVRDAGGAHEWRREAYAPVIAGIRERCPGIVVCATTSGRSGLTPEQRADVLALDGPERPDMASLTPGSLNFHTGASVNSIETVEYLAAAMKDSGVRPELEIFDLGMAMMTVRLIENGLLPEQNYANVMLGSVNTAPADASALAMLVDRLPAGTVWAAGGLGAYQLPVNGLAVFMGGHVRTGLEDNPDRDFRDADPATNEWLVKRTVELARIAERTVATAKQTREMLGLSIPEVPAVSNGIVRSTV